MMMPLIRCRIEVMAGSGKWNLPRSRFTGRLLFTALSHSLLVPRNRENRRRMVGMLGPENQYDTGNRLVQEGRSEERRVGKECVLGWAAYDWTTENYESSM